MPRIIKYVEDEINRRGLLTVPQYADKYKQIGMTPELVRTRAITGHLRVVRVRGIFALDPNEVPAPVQRKKGWRLNQQGPERKNERHASN